MSTSNVVPEGLQRLIKEKVFLCFQCGTCVGGCPVSKVNPEYNPRKIIEELVLGQWEHVLSSDIIWLCAYCHTCFEVCPQRVGISHIFVELRNLAARMRKTPTEVANNALQIITTGRVTPLTSAIERRRAELKLPKIQPINVDEIKKMVVLTGLEPLLMKEKRG